MSGTASLIETDVDLAPFTTLHVHSRAASFVRVSTLTELKVLLADPEVADQPLFILGGGSNVLFVNDFEGLIVQVGITGREVVREDRDHLWLKVGAGENWHRLVRYCVEQGWGGIENLSLIPGTVGAAPIQNIGAYGVELRDVFESLTAVELESGKRRSFDKEDCRFGYRDSIFKGELKGRYVVADVTLRLAKTPQLHTEYGAIREKLSERGIENPTIRDISDVVIAIRNSKLPDPAQLANAGSFFKNPIIPAATYQSLKSRYPDIPGYPADPGHTKVPAGWLIEQTGWKGKVKGRVGTYRQQALVIVNHGGASGAEILALAEEIQHDVKQKFSIDLVPEVNIV